MAINKNHEFEELDGVKCGIVEKNVSPERVEFLKKILTFNGYTVVVVASPLPKIAVAKPAPANDAPAEAVAPPPPPQPVPVPSTLTVGVTDYTFNTINAIYGRMLKMPNGSFVTRAYWYQELSVNNDEVPYYEA